ncbi:hypothetical protein EV121DRAFT_297180 [Schizophyllum commune]
MSSSTSKRAKKTRLTGAGRGRKSIFSEDQRGYLNPFVEGYKKPGKGPGRGKGEDFWNELFPGFFERWPPSDEEARENIRAQIKSYLARQATLVNKKTIWQKHARRILASKKSSPKRWTNNTLYKFYLSMDAHKPKIDERALELHGDDPPSQILATKLRVAKEFWKDEPEEVREEVRAAANAAYEARLARHQVRDIDETDEGTREEARANMVSALKPWIQEVLKITGCTAGTFICGLPPAEGRPKVRCIMVNVGTTTARRGKSSFDEYDVDAYQDFVEAFAAFVGDTTDLFHDDDDSSRETQQVLASHGEVDPFAGCVPFESEQYVFRSRDDGDIQQQGPSEGGADGETAEEDRREHEDRPRGEGAEEDRREREDHSRDEAREREDLLRDEAREAQTRAEQLGDNTNPAGETPNDDPRHDDTHPPMPTPTTRRRPRPRVITVPSSFSGHVVKDIALELPFRELLQTLSTEARQERYAIMKTWSIADFDNAHKLASDAAALGGSRPDRDAAALKDIFQRWSHVPSAPSTSGGPAAQRKRPRDEDEDEDDDSSSDEYHPAHEEDDADDVAGEPTEVRRSTRRRTRKAPRTDTLDVEGAQSAGDDQLAGPSTEPHASTGPLDQPDEDAGPADFVPPWESAPIFEAEQRKHLPLWMFKCFMNVEKLAYTEDSPAAAEAWHELVGLWALIESLNDFKDEGARLSSERRPPWVSSWIKWGRSPSFEPWLLQNQDDNEDEEEAAAAAYDKFREDMKAWWHAINPDWRPRSTSFSLGRGEGDWSKLFCPGQNGLISVVKCLKWWWELLEEIDEIADDRAQWFDAVDEVTYTLGELYEQQQRTKFAENTGEKGATDVVKSTERTAVDKNIASNEDEHVGSNVEGTTPGDTENIIEKTTESIVEGTTENAAENTAKNAAENAAQDDAHMAPPSPDRHSSARPPARNEGVDITREGIRGGEGEGGCSASPTLGQDGPARSEDSPACGESGAAGDKGRVAGDKGGAADDETCDDETREDESGAAEDQDGETRGKGGMTVGATHGEDVAAGDEGGANPE